MYTLPTSCFVGRLRNEREYYKVLDGCSLCYILYSLLFMCLQVIKSWLVGIIPGAM